MDHYRAYNQAVEDNDLIAADQHGEAAWRAAEDEWGDAQETAVLALNLARLRIDEGNAADAREPARRALELAEVGLLDGAASIVDAELLAATADVADGRARRGELERLRSAITAYAQDAAQGEDLSARAELVMAQGLLENDEAVEAAEHARHVVEIAAALGAGYEALAIEGAVLEGAAHMTGRNASDAHAAFDMAAEMFPDDARAANSTAFAEVSAWRSLAARIDEVSTEPVADDQVCRSRGGVFTRAANIFLDDDLPPELNCGEWEGRVPPQYPHTAAEQVIEGAVVIVYSLDADGRVEDARVAAEAPVTDVPWDALSIRSMSEWRRNLPPDAPPACRAPQSTTFTFVIRC
ncbi:MAG: energy transducer TonB [Maricaulaceae bacterium]|jgi:hypothetical protein